MITNQVGSFTADARLISFKSAEFLRSFRCTLLSLEIEARKELAQVFPLELTESGELRHPFCTPPDQKVIDDYISSQSQSTPIAPPPGPRKRQKDYDGSKPLYFRGHEAAAQHFSTPRSQRDFKTITTLARHFNVSRKTIYDWKRDPDVLLRTEYLSRANQFVGNLVARREWQPIVEAQVAEAKKGSTSAAIFCARFAWPPQETLEEALK